MTSSTFAPLPESLSSRIQVQDNGCWQWTGAVSKKGYGAAYHAGRCGRAHRMIYGLLVGVVPTGLTLDHLCRVRHCVNPDHLEVVTNTENTLRGESPSALNARKTHCVNGHEFTPENTRITSNGDRKCRACDRTRCQRRRSVRRQARSADTFLGHFDARWWKPAGAEGAYRGSDGELWLDTGLTAELLTCGTTAVNDWCDNGKLKYARTSGSHRRVRLDEINRLRLEHCNRLTLTVEQVIALAATLDHRSGGGA